MVVISTLPSDVHGRAVEQYLKALSLSIRQDSRDTGFSPYGPQVHGALSGLMMEHAMMQVSLEDRFHLESRMKISFTRTYF